MNVHPEHSTIEDFAAWLSEGCHKPSAKFLRDMLVGIYRARSVNLTEIAAALSESIIQHATQKRLSRNLMRKDLAAFVADQVLDYAAGYVKAGTTLVVISHSLEKPRPRKMQYQDKLSCFTHADYSYRICEIVAHDAGTDSYTPLLSVLWSRHAPDYVSDTNEIRRAIDRVLTATNGRGVLALTPDFLPEETINELIQSQKYRFTAKVLGGHLNYSRQTHTIDDLIEHCDTPFGGTMFKLGGIDFTSEKLLFMQYGSLPIQLTNSKQPLRLAVLKTTNQSGEAGKAMAMITSELKSRSRQAHIDQITTQFLVWNLAESILEQKGSFSPGGFRVLNYQRLQLLMTLLHAVIFFDAQTTAHLKNRLVSLKPIPGDYVRDFLLPGDTEVSNG